MIKKKKFGGRHNVLGGINQNVMTQLRHYGNAFQNLGNL